MLGHLGARLERLELPPDLAIAWVAMGAVLLVGTALFLFLLGAAELCSTNEAAEGLAVQRMVEHGELLAPALNGHAPMFKPPLFHWTAAGIARALGVHEATELTVRLPSVVFALVCTLLVMIFVRSFLGLSNALLAGGVLLASYQYTSAARFGRVDMALTCCEFLALSAFASWAARMDAAPERRPRHADAALYVFAVGLGLGVLAKGPVGMVLPLATALAVLVTTRRWASLRALASPGPALLVLIVSSAWYVACLWTRRLDVLERQLVYENFSRFVGGIGTMSPFYYLKPLLLNSAPLSLVVPFAVVRALRSGPRRESAEGGGVRDVRPFALAVFWIVTVVFFSVAAYKRRAYLLPLWPPAAVLLVWWLSTWRGERERHVAKAALALLCGALIVFNAAYVPHAERAACGGADYRAAAAAINSVVPRDAALYLGDDAGIESASLLFYLDRTAPLLKSALADAPTGYVLVPERAWTARPPSTKLFPLLEVALERRRLILVETADLRHAHGDRRGAMTLTNEKRAP